MNITINILIKITNSSVCELQKNVNAQIGIIFWIVVRIIMVFHFIFSMTENTHGWNGMDPIFNKNAIDKMINWNEFISILFIFSVSKLIELLDWINKLIKNKADEIKLTRK